MKQRTLRVALDGLLGDLIGGYDADADVRQSVVDWLVDVAGEAGFGEQSVELDRRGALAAWSQIEAHAREPLRFEVRISRRRSLVRSPDADFVVELRCRDGSVVTTGAAPVLSLAIMHAARSLAVLNLERGSHVTTR